MKLNDKEMIIDFNIFLVSQSKIAYINFLAQIEVIKVCNDKSYIFYEAGHFE